MLWFDGGGGGGGGGGGFRNGDDCPQRVNIRLVDILRHGNLDKVKELESGDELNIDIFEDTNLIVAIFDDHAIGSIPPHYGIADCIKKGWTYKGSIVSVDWEDEIPKIDVLVIGTP